MAKVNFLHGTEINYEGLSTKDSNTLYLLTDTKKIYKGDTLIAGCYKGEIDEEELSDSTKSMTGTFTIMNGYCFMSVTAQLKAAPTVSFNLPVNETTTGTVIASSSSNKYFCTTTSSHTVQISNLAGGNCAVESISFTLIYPVADNAIYTLEQAAISS